MNRLFELRSQLDLTHRDLEEYTGISFSTFSMLEHGTRPFRQVHIDKLTAFFGVTSDYLLAKSDSGYIVFTETGSDELVLSESEYNRLNEFIKPTIIEHDNTFEMKIGDKTVCLPKYQVYRELKGSPQDYELKETLCLKLDELKKRMTEEDLKKTIKFIEDYILK